jgi:hypothetical protein
LIGIKIAAAILSLCFAIDLKGQNQEPTPEFDRPNFYKVMETGDLAAVNRELTVLEGLIFLEKDAFVGALTMKKAGFAAAPGKKLNLFKSGHYKLETAIQKDSTNGELRFLRLLIQENAPGFLGYKKDIEKDQSFIRKSYNNLPESVQEAIRDYSKKSKKFKLADS